MKCLLSGDEVKVEKASLRLSFSIKSKIDSCFQRRKGEHS